MAAQAVLVLGFGFGLVALFPTSIDLPWYTGGGSLYATTLAIFGEYELEVRGLA
jgi:hypothetical protein